MIVGHFIMKRLTNRILFHLISWLVAYNIFSIFIYLILREREVWGSRLPENMLWASFAAIVIGILLGTTDYFIDRFERYFKSIGRVILSKSILYVLVISLTILIVSLFNLLISGEMDFWAFLKSPPFSTVFLFSIITCIILNFIVQVNKKFGQGELKGVAAPEAAGRDGVDSRRSAG